MKKELSLKVDILIALTEIEKVANKYRLSGTIILPIDLSGEHYSILDDAIEMIQDYPRSRHYFQVAPAVTVAVMAAT